MDVQTCTAVLVILIQFLERCLSTVGGVFSSLNLSPAFALSFTGVTGANAGLGLIGSEAPPHLYLFFN